jgi:hypothetical protein
MHRGSLLECRIARCHVSAPINHPFLSVLQLPKGDTEQMAEKRATMRFTEIQDLNFGYRELVRIDNLMGLNGLVKLRLDCNRISVIENLSHLVRCTSKTRLNGLITSITHVGWPFSGV